MLGSESGSRPLDERDQVREAAGQRPAQRRGILLGDLRTDGLDFILSLLLDLLAGRRFDRIYGVEVFGRRPGSGGHRAKTFRLVPDDGVAVLAEWPCLAGVAFRNSLRGVQVVTYDEVFKKVEGLLSLLGE